MSTDTPSESPSDNSRSLLSRNSKITGDLEFPGQVEVLGRIDGQIKADSALIGEKGEVEGSIKAQTIVIKGRVNGDIIGKSVTLHTGSQVNGEITYHELVVEAGARVDGGIHRAKD
ncbi:MAG: cytoskeletal protein CcmA (bactofilin family) [Paracoccaceae bacterium]|jgi:cytoskeletal protein CcmA (bactofilin family)